jgi:hypothetical protein
MVNEAKEATENIQEERPGQLPGIMSRQMAIYCSNCAMGATTPKDISLILGVPGVDEWSSLGSQ